MKYILQVLHVTVVTEFKVSVKDEEYSKQTTFRICPWKYLDITIDIGCVLSHLKCYFIVNVVFIDEIMFNIFVHFRDIIII